MKFKKYMLILLIPISLFPISLKRNNQIANANSIESLQEMAYKDRFLPLTNKQKKFIDEKIKTIKDRENKEFELKLKEYELKIKNLEEDVPKFNTKNISKENLDKKNNLDLKRKQMIDDKNLLKSLKEKLNGSKEDLENIKIEKEFENPKLETMKNEILKEKEDKLNNIYQKEEEDRKKEQTKAEEIKKQKEKIKENKPKEEIQTVTIESKPKENLVEYPLSVTINGVNYPIIDSGAYYQDTIDNNKDTWTNITNLYAYGNPDNYETYDDYLYWSEYDNFDGLYKSVNDSNGLMLASHRDIGQFIETVDKIDYIDSEGNKKTYYYEGVLDSIYAQNGGYIDYTDGRYPYFSGSAGDYICFQTCTDFSGRSIGDIYVFRGE